MKSSNDIPMSGSTPTTSLSIYLKHKIYLYIPARTAQGGGGSFKYRTPVGKRFVVVSHGWQSKSTDGSKGKVFAASAYLSVYLYACLTTSLTKVSKELAKKLTD